MAFLQFPSKMQVKVMDGDINQNILLGSFDLNSSLCLENIRFMFIKNGVAGGSETLQMKLSSTDAASNAYINSNIINVSDITTDDYWVGWVRFDFSGQVLSPDFDYFVSIEYDNYTRNEDVFFLAYSFDDVWGMNDFNASDDFGATMQIVGKRQ